MKYLSFFSGIGGFEVAIYRVFPDAECIGYSEISTPALKVYKKHFPTHENLGDITKISLSDIRKLVKKKGGCDLIFGGFPCKNLSSLATLNINGDSGGLEGNQSKLFYNLLRIFKVLVSINKNIHFVFENNTSMKLSNRILITNLIKQVYSKDVYLTKLDSSLFGVQTRKRLFWTDFNIPIDNIKCIQTWNDVLEPVENIIKYKVSEKMLQCLNKTYEQKNSSTVKTIHKCEHNDNFYMKFTPNVCYRSRWDMGFISDTMEQKIYVYPVGKSRTILSSSGNNNLLIDRRFGNNKEFIVRKMATVEKEKLFGFDIGYTQCLNSFTAEETVLGNSVVVHVIVHIFQSLILV